MKEELNLSDLLKKISSKDYIIVIEDDLTESLFKINDETKQNLDNLISEKIGFCFESNNDDYSYWEYNVLKQKYNYYERRKRQKFYLHDKLHSDLNIEKI